MAATGSKSYNLFVSHERKPEHAVKLNVIQPKSVLNRSGMGGFTLNPYKGCPVGCSYCYVDHMPHMRAEERTWGTYVDVKENAPELLERQLKRLRTPANIFLSTATDPYQPAEERYLITRRMLEVLARYPEHGLFILTKQSLVERDADLLEKLPRVGVGMSISTVNDRLAKIIEPWAPVTSERLAIIKRLAARGIQMYVLWAPAIVPQPMTESFVDDAIRAISETGADALSLDTLNYRASQPAGMIRRLAREGHAPATDAQARQIERAARRRGLGNRIDLIEPGTLEPLQPLLPF